LFNFFNSVDELISLQLFQDGILC